MLRRKRIQLPRVVGITCMHFIYLLPQARPHGHLPGLQMAYQWPCQCREVSGRYRLKLELRDSLHRVADITHLQIFHQMDVGLFTQLITITKQFN